MALRLRIKAGPLFTCGRCSMSYSNPLGHVCSSRRGDFGRRKTAHARRQKAARKPREAHDCRACRDQDCERPLCTAWREAWAEGHRLGYAEGEEDGYLAGYTAGQASVS